jgi:hypothetical protein
MGGACSKHGEMRNAYTCSKNVKKRDDFGSLGVHEMIILK